ncbi:hypothetical protein E4U13_004300 [Claviceps humidiphila]|uniref:superoxide dismutase n=1 Tax=Claviceps humidiphila TaxID=1294629 RepID=A0A9P7TT68_9HYPO|nr:hypothetical protein E4U13_004300 [Claviceps humidiphila]
MRTSTRLLAILAALEASYAAEIAAVVTKNPLDVIYTATLPSEPFFEAPGLSGNVKGFISASAPPDGVGVRFTVRFQNLPKTGGPFPYHIHLKKAAGGNCTAAGPHLDPTDRGDKLPCDAGNQPSCQVGDLAGKYGRINSDPFTAEYVDKYLSLKEDDPAFFGNRSFVIHLANNTRVTCANFVKGGASEPNVSSLPTGERSACAQLPEHTTSSTVLLPTSSSGSSSTTVTNSLQNPSSSGSSSATVTRSLSGPSSSNSSSTIVTHSLPSPSSSGAGSTTATTEHSTPSDPPSETDDEDCPAEETGSEKTGATSACASSPVSHTSLSTVTPTGNTSLASPPVVLAAAGKMTPALLAWWTCTVALLITVLG